MVGLAATKLWILQTAMLHKFHTAQHNALEVHCKFI